MASNCWCWFSVYFAASITLGVIAITATMQPTSKNSHSQEPLTSALSANASEALRRAGFILMADLLHRSPPFFLPPQNTTFFAIKDSAITNASLPRWFLKSLLLYHTTTSKSTFQDLLNNPTGTCIETLFRQKNVSVTKVEPLQQSVEINRVLVSNPDIFLGDYFVIHGVVAPFSPLRRQDLQGGSDFIHPPTCRPIQKATNSTKFDESKNSVFEWNRIVQVLGSKGYSSFSIALNSVLDGIQKDSLNWDSATIFAPPDLGLFVGYPSGLLDRAVRLHVLPQRLTYSELSSLPVRTLLKTVMPGEALQIDGVLDFMPGVVVSGVEIVAPDLFTSEKFVVHGISRAFEMAEVTA